MSRIFIDTNLYGSHYTTCPIKKMKREGERNREEKREIEKEGKRERGRKRETDRDREQR